MEVMERPSVVKDIQPKVLFGQLYESAFPPVARFVSKMGGNFDDAKDVFQDALIVFYEKRQDPEFTIKTAEQAYLLGIAKHLWIAKFKNTRHLVSLDETEAAITIPDDFYPAVNENALMQLIENTGKKCLSLLRAFYYQNIPVKHIAHSLGYSSEHSASVQKYKCIEKLRTTLKQQAISYEDLTD